ncbi:MAG TPA: tRNA lysidine(34) synthetase TilS [Pyrinomonadaceae bacterium]|nr:tRNA lysidine(34) synthetase TilS [Pyrinomonadaceae bacterium]
MHSFLRNLITEWRRLKLPVEEDVVVVGVSGGADSVSLLLALDHLRLAKKLDVRIVAAHFNHRLRDGESDADEEFVRALTTERKIEFAARRAGALDQGNLEQNARAARYDFLRQVAEDVNAFAVVTGHTINDQAETFLMNLLRGSGPEGLCGMKTVRPIVEGPPKGADGCEIPDVESDEVGPLLFPTSPLLVRPLLSWAKRGDTEEFCRHAGVSYRYDSMNEDTAFRRVRIRKILIPLLEDMNPNIIETIARTATLLQHVGDISARPDRSGPAGELKLGDLREFTVEQRRDEIRSWLRARRGTNRRLQLKHIEAIERLVLSEKSGRIAELPGGRVVKTAGKLVYEENKVEN